MYFNEGKFKFLIIIFLIFLVAFSIDYIKVKLNTSPLFCIKTKTYDNNDCLEYKGLGYKVIKYVTSGTGIIEYEIGTWFMKFDETYIEDLTSKTSINDYKKIKFNSRNIQTHLYVKSFVNPRTDIIKSENDLSKYKKIFKNDTLYETLDIYKEDYFIDKILVIVTLQESSGSITNKVDTIEKSSNGNNINVFVKRSAPEIGTDDMAIWHLLIEINNNDLGDLNSVDVIYSDIN